MTNSWNDNKSGNRRLGVGYMLRSMMLMIACGALAPHVSAEEPALPLPAEPKHGRPYLMPEVERQRIRGLIAREGWAKQEYEQLTKKAEGGIPLRARARRQVCSRCDQMAARESFK
tara:strand:- start:60 stop:407 length:348 start_codon:yes stop_codon:yes gene_type:complete